MKRYLLILIFVSLCAGIHAQDYFSETAAKAKRATPHEAAYIWSEYQQFLPTFHATYFHLGNIYYDLIPTEHPIRDYANSITAIACTTPKTKPLSPSTTKVYLIPARDRNTLIYSSLSSND